jgi:hypothetical protein
MITSLHLANFKAFAETQHIPILPLFTGNLIKKCREEIKK